jgi:hypothetical protein
MRVDALWLCVKAAAIFPTTSAASQTFPQALLVVSQPYGFIESVRFEGHHDTYISAVFSAFAEKSCSRVEENRPGPAWLMPLC